MRLIVLIGLGLLSLTVHAEDWQEKKANYFADQATNEFKLDSVQRQSVYAYKVNQYSLYHELTKKNESGEYPSDQAFNLAKAEFWRDQKKELANIIGVQMDELNAFLNKMRKELPKV